MAASGLSKVSYAAVGMLYFFIKSFENALEPSISAAFFLGPNTLNPSASKASTTPITNGSSIPIMVKSITSSFANATNFSISVAAIETHSANCAIPAFPGAQYILSTFLLCATFHTMACSRPPPPTISTFMLFLLVIPL